AKVETIPFSGSDHDWPGFRVRFRAMLHAARLDDIAEGRAVDYRLNSVIYTRVLDSVSSTSAADHIEGKVAFGDGPSAWAVLCARYDKRSEDNIIFIENDIQNTRLANGGDLDDHLAKLFKLFRLLEECGAPLNDATKIRRIKMSLSPEYDTTVNIAEHRMYEDPRCC
ncbi:MAG: hypothetical protein AAFV49_24175, partial [Pseudomonadota bacterium]